MPVHVVLVVQHVLLSAQYRCTGHKPDTVLISVFPVRPPHIMRPQLPQAGSPLFSNSPERTTSTPRQGVRAQGQVRHCRKLCVPAQRHRSTTQNIPVTPASVAGFQGQQESARVIHAAPNTEESGSGITWHRPSQHTVLYLHVTSVLKQQQPLTSSPSKHTGTPQIQL